MYNFFSPYQITPCGWLKDQLTIQANGLAGNLDKMWPDVRDSAWIGGNREGWERVPYWLDGFIPLAFLLRDEDMIARAEKYVSVKLFKPRSGNATSGWKSRLMYCCSNFCFNVGISHIRISLVTLKTKFLMVL